MVRIVNDAIGIIGGGIVGVALARALTLSGHEVIVFEKERRLAQHQTGHNSGVVHAGIYYPPGSLKAMLCARGRAQIRDYCHQHRLPYRELGKLVVATSTDELGALAELERRSRASNVPGLRRIGPREILDIEPYSTGVAALHSPHTAVVDFAAITESMAQEVRAGGGSVLLGHEVTAIRLADDRVVVRTPTSVHRLRRLVACAGLQSDLVAGLAGADPSPRILPFRGEYWQMRASRSALVRGMIYPVPDSRFPFLGVHFTRGVYGDVHVGPSAVPALAREGYNWLTVSARDTWESLRWPGAAALLRRHWRMGVKEISESFSKQRYFRQARRFLPQLRMADLQRKTAAGVRAQAWAADGSLVDDFAIDQVGPVTVVRNAPSPAATSSMAIADYLLHDRDILG